MLESVGFYTFIWFKYDFQCKEFSNNLIGIKIIIIIRTQNEIGGAELGPFLSGCLNWISFIIVENREGKEERNWS